MQVLEGRWAGVPAWGGRVINSLTTWCQLFLVHAWHAEPMLYLLDQRTIVQPQLELQLGGHFYQGSVWMIVAMFLSPVFLHLLVQQYYQLFIRPLLIHPLILFLYLPICLLSPGKKPKLIIIIEVVRCKV